ncbi:unnamed protein product [Phyllotreta striolata]|uniref:TrmE-type G domain-containing protein n=1 Tax=Phyllotreta striolata TaxID=444603 RepID=A0A9N9XMC4_PHYSR|nr:unnamed protein product [Phyllotreta striolata]
MIKYSRLLLNPTKLLHTLSSETIFALSSGHGKCGVAVIRVSGSNSITALKQMTSSKPLPQPRVATLRSIKDPTTNEIIDKSLVLWFPGPKSFTGEDSFELQVHGGLAVINAVLKALSAIPRCRLAEPGEFTKRAFFNGKLDLTEVEGLADLLQAETELQRKQAFLQSQGSLSKLYGKWRSTLKHCMAHIEAYIDFEETETLETGIIESVRRDIEKLAEELKAHLSNGRRGEILRNGVKTVILGEPNAGKSSLLNLLCARPAAIVTPIPGTTRDVLEVTLNIDGYPLVLADTAGLRARTEDLIEQEGIHRAIQLYHKSDFVILVINVERYLKWKQQHTNGSLKDYIVQYVDGLNLPKFFIDRKNLISTKPCVMVFNKIDLADRSEYIQGENYLSISCTKETGVDDLIRTISQHLKRICGEPSAEHPSMNQLRHREHLGACLGHLESFLAQHQRQDTVLMAEHLRKSMHQLGKLVGSVTAEELLDVIFRDFCVGK